MNFLFFLALLFDAFAAPTKPQACHKIGVIAELSRKTARTSKPFGTDIVRGAELAQKEILGMCFSTTVLDFGNSIANIPDIIRRSAAQGIHLYLGLGASDQVFAAIPALKETKSILITPTASSNDIARAGEPVVMMFPRNELIAESLAVEAKKAGCDSVISIYASNNVYSTDMKNSFEKEFVKRGGTLETSIQVRSGEVSFDDKTSALRGSKASCAFVPLYELDVARVLSAFQKNDIHKMIIGSDSWGSDSRVVINLSDSKPLSVLLPSIYSTDESNSRNKAFVKNYETKYGAAPSDLGAFSYEGFHLAAQMLQVCDSQEVQQNTSQCLAKVLPLNTLMGTVSSATFLSLDRRVPTKRLSVGKRAR